MLEARVVKARPSLVVDVALRLDAGASLALFGPSGAGKSTVLACLAGAETPDDGRVTLDGATLFPPSVALHRRAIGYLTQDSQLFPHLSVAGNVRFGRGADADGAWLAELRDRLGLEVLWKAPAHEISGGQARRVALARMLARKPRLVLLDEPFTGLDRALVRDLLDSIATWREALGFGLLVVDHDIDVLERLCARALVVEDGRVAQAGTWAELRANPATATLENLLRPL